MTTNNRNTRTQMNNTNQVNNGQGRVPISRIRNIGIAAHIDAGKTTLTERILFHAGAIHQAGEVHDGTTTTDFNPIEQSKGITIFAAAVSCTWTPRDESALGVSKLGAGDAHSLNVIDTPGHVDFTAEVERSLRVLDGVVTVFSGVEGVQPQSETVWRQADRYHVPRVAFVNKMDRTGADFARVVGELNEKLGANAWPVLWPLGSEGGLRGQLDIINEVAVLFREGRAGGYTIEDVPPELVNLVTAQRAELVTRIAECDDEVAALWLANQRVPALLLKAAVRRATIANRFVPVVGGSAYKFIGVQALLDAIVDYLPSPADLPSIDAHALQDEGVVAVSAEATAPLAALAFKIATDPTTGRLVMMRVYSGTLRKGDRVLNPRTGQTSRAGRLVRVHADRREEIESASAGEIVAVAGMRGVATGDTLCSEERPLLMEPPSFPEPVVSMAIEPERSTESQRLATQLQMLSEDDPTFHVSTHPETGQTLIAGMGELHLEVMRERLRTELGLETKVGPPEIAYRETITKSAEADYLLKKQSGGAGMYARVVLAVQPAERGSGVRIENRVSGGNIPTQFHSAVRKGIEDAARGGVLGYTLVDAHISILDGAAHVKDSNEMAFRLAAAEALREALRAAGPVLLEPVMRVELATPLEHQGDLLGDLTRRRAKILGVKNPALGAEISAEVALRELWGYANAIRSLSRGRASYSMTPSHFEPVSSAVTAELRLKAA
ncbi:MAG: translation elongation factor 2 [Pedosphaera sp.]|nr:translation elongation factor 2 [Pedosphaera sp.]